MAIKFRDPAGYEFEVSTPREAVELRRLLESRVESHQPTVSPAQHDGNGPVTDPRVIRVLTFLRLLLSAGSDGVGQDELVSTLNLKSTKGLGGFNSLAKNVLKNGCQEPEKVYARRRVKGEMRWFGNPTYIQDVLEWIEDPDRKAQSISRGTSHPGKDRWS